MHPLQIKDLSISYGTKTIITGFSHAFDTGSYAILGSNGCGKTSLLKALSGIIPVSKNSVFFNGKDITTSAIAVKQQLSFVPDEPFVYPFMTGRDLLGFIASVRKTRIGEDIEAYIQQFGITRFMDTEFRHMSFGTQRKFTIIAGMIDDPKVLLLDEPLNGLDIHSKEIFTDYLNNKSDYTTILFTSHNEELIVNTHAETLLLEKYQT